MFKLLMQGLGLTIVMAFSEVGYAQGAYLKLKDVEWTGKDPVKGKIQYKFSSCNSEQALYVRLIDTNSKLIEEKIFKPHDISGEIIFLMQYAGIEPVIGVVAYILDGQKGFSYDFVPVSRLPILADKNNTIDEKPSITLFPEGELALLNYYTRVGIKINTTSNKYIGKALLVNNPRNETLAVTKFDDNGFAFAQVPFFANDTLLFKDIEGNLFETLIVNDCPFVQTEGFHIEIGQITNQLLHIEMRKGVKEVNNRVGLKVRYSNLLLYELGAIFKGDTTMVGTDISTDGLEDKLLSISLEDETGKKLLERMMYIPPKNESFFYLGSICPWYLPFNLNSNWVPSISVSDYLIPVKAKMDAGQVSPDNGFTLSFRVPDVSSGILSYQITDSSGRMIDLGDASIEKDGTFRIPNLDFDGPAQITFFVKRGEPVPDILPEKFSFPAEESKIISDSLRNLAENAWNQNRLEMSPDSNYIYPADSYLEEVKIVAKRKTREQELEDKYLNNNMFRSLFSMSFDLENDPYVVNYDIFNYLTRKVPGLTYRPNPANPLQNTFIYRQGVVEVYLDEYFIGQASQLPFFNLNDIGYIRFNKQPVSAMRNEAGGGMLQSRSMIAGVTATLLIYTKKYSEDKPTATATRIPIMGYSN
jgi:hypothetical protein